MDRLNCDKTDKTGARMQLILRQMLQNE